MPKTRSVLISVFLLSAALLGIGLAGQYKVRTEDGVTIVMNGKKPDAPRGAAVKPVLKENYSAGRGDNPDEMISESSGIAVTEDGTVYVADMKESRIKVFDANGKFLRAFGKKGQGPGELSQPIGILISPDGEIIIEDALNRRLAFFKPDGAFLRHVSTAKALGLSGVMIDAEGQIIARSMGLADGGKMFMDVKTYDRDLNPKIKLASVDFPNPLQTRINPFSAMSLIYTLDSGGNIYMGTQKDYEIRVISPEGTLIRRIGRNYDPVPITKEDKDEMLAKIPNLAGVNVKDMVQFPDVYPAYGYFLPADDGRLLVRTYEKGKAKKEYFWDVFDAEGRYVAKVLSKTEFLVWKSGKAYGIEEDEEGYKILKCYLVRWEK